METKVKRIMVLGAGGGPLAVASLAAIEQYCQIVRSKRREIKLNEKKDSRLTDDLAELAYELDNNMPHTIDDEFSFSLIVVEKNKSCEPEINKKVIRFLQDNHGSNS